MKTAWLLLAVWSVSLVGMEQKESKQAAQEAYRKQKLQEIRDKKKNLKELGKLPDNMNYHPFTWGMNVIKEDVISDALNLHIIIRALLQQRQKNPHNKDTEASLRIWLNTSYVMHRGAVLKHENTVLKDENKQLKQQLAELQKTQAAQDQNGDAQEQLSVLQTQLTEINDKCAGLEVDNKIMAAFISSGGRKEPALSSE